MSLPKLENFTSTLASSRTFSAIYPHSLIGTSAAPIMTVNHDCDRDTGGQQSRPSRSRQHDNTCDSSSLSPSQDNPGSSESIFNAIRVATPNWSARRSGTAYDMGPVMEEGLAADIAMFIPADSSRDDQSRRAANKADTAWWQSHMHSEQVWHPLPNQSSPLADTQHAHRRAISLDTTDRNLPSPNWPGKLGSAVTTAQPPYPPPERQPTPPGLPSFNTPEAVFCSAQFLVGRNGRAGPQQHSIPSNGQRTASYGDTLRRFFGLSPPTETRAGTIPSAVGIGRAEDGTMVQGRFPYRQSGHGVYLTRQLHDHPFHQDHLPAAEHETEADRDEADPEAASSKDPQGPARPRRRVRIQTPPSIRRFWPTADGRSTSTPENAASTHPRKPARSIALLNLTRTSPQQDTPSRAAPSTGAVESSVQGVGLMSAHNPSPPTQLQSVLAQTPSEERAVEDSHPPSPHAVSDALAWLPAQIYAHCCLGGHCVHESREDLEEALEVVESRDTYATAREHQPGYLSWISSVYYRIWPRPRPLISDQSAV